VPSIGAPGLAAGDSASFSQSFDTRHVGSGKTLTASGSVSDDNGGNDYAVSFVASNGGSISARAISVSAVADSKVYDGGSASWSVPSIGAPGLAAGDSASFSQSFDTRHVGSGKTLTASGSVSDGNGGNDYAVSFVASNGGSISARAISVSAVADSRVYDGTTSSSGVPSIGAPGLAPGDSASFSQSFDTRHVGSGKTLTASGSVSD